MKLFPDCQEALGISKGLVKDSQFTASSSYDEHHQPYHARLNKTVKGSRGGWCSAFADETEFLEVDLGKKTGISGELMFDVVASKLCCQCYVLVVDVVVYDDDDDDEDDSDNDDVLQFLTHSSELQ